MSIPNLEQKSVMLTNAAMVRNTTNVRGLNVKEVGLTLFLPGLLHVVNDCYSLFSYPSAGILRSDKLDMGRTDAQGYLGRRE
jgi:hypothetical protein